MSAAVAQAIVRLFALYALAGAIFAVIFLIAGVARVDPGTASAPKALRLLIFPGIVAFWPMFARRWFAGVQAPDERNPHRDRAVSAHAVTR